eukprot:COSAG04_NODE_4818_length_1880_cov_2.384615_2_plen_81_part_01
MRGQPCPMRLLGAPLTALIAALGPAPSRALGWCNGEKLSQPCGGSLRGEAWCDASAPTAARVQALLANLSVAEKATLLATP